ncbi:HpcH/HpaI aldolase/citrate lyase family protein [Caenimonas aquaedulcis]|uniref:CoA ester lyase n=1 Tax=Caenimonas aquaedulcis TaxID=2793270 RepID=A0A931MH84_9BURK|nr:CoA ester lyase [Caenimonas aquaedulcis]MBG9387965.1 CoA ester lyase [Caenimonas aquaedulcis]
MRSKLFVPGSRPELFAKALSSAADAISIDLEDAVLEAQKPQARHTVREFLAGLQPRSGKTIIVRVNDMSTPHFKGDLEAVLLRALDMVNLPKIESADQILQASSMMARIERERGITSPIGILANIESPLGLMRASEIARADPRVRGLQVGFGDLFEPLSIDRADAAAKHHVQFMVRMAAGTAGIAAYDGAFPNVSDLAGFREEAQGARRLGFAGKSCIHPSQVSAANEAFRPTEAECAFARKVLEAWKDAEARGVGAILVEGRMIDKPFVVRAHEILRAEAAAKNS